MSVGAAAAAAIGAAVAAGATAWQASIARDAEHREVRAYVSMTSIRLVNRDQTWFDIIPEWENGGNSQTTNMTAYINMLAIDGPMPDKIMYSDTGGGAEVPIVLGPKSVSKVSFLQIPGDCIDRFNKRNGVKSMYIWGHANYNDVFATGVTPKEHITRFCFNIDQIVLSDDRKSARLSYFLCNEGNCTDAECPAPEKRTFELQASACEIAPAAPSAAIPSKAR